MSSHVTRIFGIEISGATGREVRDRITAFLQSDRPHRVATVNPEMLVAARWSPSFRRILASFELRVPDGSGLQFVSRLFYNISLPERITGNDVLEIMCETCSGQGQRVFFLGGEEGRAAGAADAMRARYPTLEIRAVSGGKIVKRDDQWHMDPAVLEEIRSFQPAAIAVALGHEKQELWIQDFVPTIPSLRLAVGVGGAFAFLSGFVPRAPRWMQQIGLEWFWRLCFQPKRWRRVLNAVVIFPVLAFLDRLRPISEVGGEKSEVGDENGK